MYSNNNCGGCCQSNCGCQSNVSGLGGFGQDYIWIILVVIIILCAFGGFGGNNNSCNNGCNPTPCC